MKSLCLITAAVSFVFILQVTFTSAYHCTEHNCVNGKCISIGFTSTCHCNDNFFGPNCLKPKCSLGYCGRHGRCNNKTYRCDCEAGYKGYKCHVFIGCKDESYRCENGGVCKVTKNKIQCNCQNGFEGNYCQVACRPCGVNSLCFACSSNNFACKCKHDCIGEVQSELDFYNLSLSRTKCGNGGYCIPQNDGFTCKCLGEFGGKYCNETAIFTDCRNKSDCLCLSEDIKKAKNNHQTNFFCGTNRTITGKCRKPICLKKPCTSSSDEDLVCDFFLNNKTGKSNIFGENYNHVYTLNIHLNESKLLEGLTLRQYCNRIRNLSFFDTGIELFQCHIDDSRSLNETWIKVSTNASKHTLVKLIQFHYSNISYSNYTENDENLTFIEAIIDIKTDFNFLLPTTSSSVEVTASENSPTTLETPKLTTELRNDPSTELNFESTVETTFESILESTIAETVSEIKQNTTREISLVAGADLKSSEIGMVYFAVFAVLVLTVVAPVIFIIRKRRNINNEFTVDRQKLLDYPEHSSTQI